jgi:hypothetical protein
MVVLQDRRWSDLGVRAAPNEKQNETRSEKQSETRSETRSENRSEKQSEQRSEKPYGFLCEFCRS